MKNTNEIESEKIRELIDNINEDLIVDNYKCLIFIVIKVILNTNDNENIKNTASIIEKFYKNEERCIVNPRSMILFTHKDSFLYEKNDSFLVKSLNSICENVENVNKNNAAYCSESVSISFSFLALYGFSFSYLKSLVQDCVNSSYEGDYN